MSDHRAEVFAHAQDAMSVLEQLKELREQDAPTHGGKVLAYVYDPGMHELDLLADEAMSITRPLNGLDPTKFPSIAAMESDLVTFTRRMLNGHKRRLGGEVVGSVTSGGTESCLLAVKTARDLWRDSTAGKTSTAARPRIVAPMTVHAAFHKAAHLFNLELDLVPCSPEGAVSAADMIARLNSDVALVVVSAPCYPTGAIDPVETVSNAALAQGISCHVDACFGGFVLPWWPSTPVWDFRLPGVTSISADLHKFGYAPKGVSALMHRGRSRDRKQYFAISRWPGYPVVNATLLGSRSAAPLAAAWSIMQRLGAEGYQDLTAACVRATHAIVQAVDGISGLRVQGSPIGPAISLVTDEGVPTHERVDPHLLADELATHGFAIQHQPGLLQENDVRLPHSAHITVTPATDRVLDDLLPALRTSAAAVRGKARPRATLSIAAMRLLGYDGLRVPGPAAAWNILRLAGAVPRQTRVATRRSTLPTKLAPLMMLVESLPAPVAEALLTELLARVSEP